MSHKLNLYLALGAINGVLAFGTIGFKFFTDWSWFESFYFCLITITTIGYGEPPDLTENARYFATLLIILGVGTLGYGLTTIVQSVFATELLSTLGKRRMIKDIRHLKQHYIVCGAGRVGLRVGQEINAHKLECLFIERDEALCTNLHEQGYHVLAGDATSEEVLRDAGIDRAQGLVCALASDPENLYVTLTARDLNSHIMIVARANEESVIPRLFKAGANKVVSPVITGSHQMSQMLLKPAVADFIELATMAEELELEIEQIEIEPESSLLGQTLKEACIRSEMEVMIIAIKRADGHMIFNPSADTKMQLKDGLIAIGSHMKLEALENVANPEGKSRRMFHRHTT